MCITPERILTIHGCHRNGDGSGGSGGGGGGEIVHPSNILPSVRGFVMGLPCAFAGRK